MAVHIYTVENEVDFAAPGQLTLKLNGQLYTGQVTGSVVLNNGLLKLKVDSGEFRFGNSDKQPIALKPGETVFINPRTKQLCFEPGPIKSG